MCLAKLRVCTRCCRSELVHNIFPQSLGIVHGIRLCSSHVIRGTVLNARKLSIRRRREGAHIVVSAILDARKLRTRCIRKLSHRLARIHVKVREVRGHALCSRADRGVRILCSRANTSKRRTNDFAGCADRRCRSLRSAFQRRNSTVRFLDRIHARIKRVEKLPEYILYAERTPTHTANSSTATIRFTHEYATKTEPFKRIHDDTHLELEPFRGNPHRNVDEPVDNLLEPSVLCELVHHPVQTVEQTVHNRVESVKQVIPIHTVDERDDAVRNVIPDLVPVLDIVNHVGNVLDKAVHELTDLRCESR